MFPFIKKKESKKEISEIPELPELPPLPTIESSNLNPNPNTKEKEPLPPLPTFPSSPVGEKISRTFLKQAIEEPEEEKIEEEPVSFVKETAPKTIRLESLSTKKMTKEIKPEMKSTESIYIKVDKYQESMIKFQEIKRKLLEIESLLKEVQELKAREEKQLQEWEDEIQEVKVKLDNIDKTIFRKLEE